MVFFIQDWFLIIKRTGFIYPARFFTFHQ